MSNEVLEQLKTRLLDLDMDGTIEAVNSVVGAEDRILAKDAVAAITESLQIVGRRFQEGEWFLTELIYAGEIAKEALGLLSPLMEAEGAESAGTIVVGTVAHDLHDLGKNIFVNFARSAGFTVIDLGINVPAQKFVDAVKEHHPLALGMSCLLTATNKELVKVIEESKRQNVRDKVKIIIGGACLTEKFSRDIGADAFAPDAITGVDIIRKWAVS